MNCKDIGGYLLDISAGAPPSPEIQAHLDSCPACAAQWKSLNETMLLLDGWEAPEPSPYFNTRLRARLREEAAVTQSSWLAWFRKPVLAVGMALVMIASAGLYFGLEHAPQGPAPIADQGTAVNDLVNLDKNHDVLANFDLLDDLGQADVNSQNMNP